MSSKIKVDTIENVAGSGNVSLGSGHNLVVPGNITGSGTATITGDLTVDTSSLKVNASNNFIGIGTASPQKKVHILDTTSDGIIIFDRNGTSTDHQIVFAHNYQSGGQSGGNYYGIGVDGSENKLVFAYDANSQASLSADAKMLMDASGCVTKPLTPFVRLQLTSHVSPNTTVSAPGNQVTGFTVHENVGSYWNSSNNNFTCPVAGVYSASVFYIKYPISGNAHVDLHKNGVKVNEIRWRAPEVNAGYHQAGGTASVTCAANDVLDWHYFGSAGLHDGNGSWEIMLSH